MPSPVFHQAAANHLNIENLDKGVSTRELATAFRIGNILYRAALRSRRRDTQLRDLHIF